MGFPVYYAYDGARMEGVPAVGQHTVMQVVDQIWQVSFMDYDLGYLDMDSCRLEPGPNPFGPRVLTM